MDLAWVLCCFSLVCVVCLCFSGAWVFIVFVSYSLHTFLALWSPDALDFQILFRLATSFQKSSTPCRLLFLHYKILLNVPACAVHLHTLSTCISCAPAYTGNLHVLCTCIHCPPCMRCTHRECLFLPILHVFLFSRETEPLDESMK